MPVEFYESMYLEYIRLFNERYFYDCHEVLEDLWLDQTGPEREYFQGLIHLAAAFQLLFRGRTAGCHARFRSALRYLDAFGPRYMSLDLEAIRKSILYWIARCEHAGNAPVAYDERHVPILVLGQAEE